MNQGETHYREDGVFHCKGMWEEHTIRLQAPGPDSEHHERMAKSVFYFLAARLPSKIKEVKKMGLGIDQESSGSLLGTIETEDGDNMVTRVTWTAFVGMFDNRVHFHSKVFFPDRKPSVIRKSTTSWCFIRSLNSNEPAILILPNGESPLSLNLCRHGGEFTPGAIAEVFYGAPLDESAMNEDLMKRFGYIPDKLQLYTRLKTDDQQGTKK